MGRCKFGATCKFHHPAPSAVQVPAPSSAPRLPPVPTLYSTVQSPSGPSSEQYRVVMPRSPLMPNSYVKGPYGPLLLSQVARFLFQVGILIRNLSVPVLNPLLHLA